MSPLRLRVGVSADLLALSPQGGHGKVWHRTLQALRPLTRLCALNPRSGRPRHLLGRSPQVVLADGHARLPPTVRPLVVQVHEAGWFDPELRDLLDPDFYAEISRQTETAVKAADRVIVPSEASRRDLIDGLGVDPSVVHAVSHGADASFSPAATGGRDLVARRLGQSRPYVLYAAMIHPRKNLAVLREAMNQIVAEGFPHALVVVGGPATDREDSSELDARAGEELAAAPGRVVRIRAPSDSQLAGLMAQASAFCLPSLYEGFGLTALEAMACGAPVIVSDRGALPEVIGDAGLVVPPSAAGVAQALRHVLGSEEVGRALGQAGPARAKEFTWERTAQGWLTVLTEAAMARQT